MRDDNARLVVGIESNVKIRKEVHKIVKQAPKSFLLPRQAALQPGNLAVSDRKEDHEVFIVAKCFLDSVADGGGREGPKGEHHVVNHIVIVVDVSVLLFSVGVPFIEVGGWRQEVARSVC